MNVIVITGGSDGLGKTMAEYLSLNNKVIILSPTKEKVEMVAKKIGCDHEVCDITNHDQIEDAIGSIISKHLKIDVLINNAGLWIQDELESNEYTRIKQVIETNLLGTIYMTQVVIPYMKLNKKGTIININSQAGLNYKAQRTIYNSSKWGLTGFTKSLQPELAKYGIRVTDVYPGKMKTDMFNKLGIDKDMDDALDTIEVAKTVEFIINMPDDVVMPEVGIKNINN